MHMVPVNDVVLHVKELGDKNAPALVFSNSLGTDFRVWDRLLEALSPLPFRTILYDKRGHGLSSAPPAPYQMSQHVGDLEGLLDHFSITNAIIVGLSVGGLIAQGLTARRPDLVRALVLSDTAHVIGNGPMWNTRIEAVQSGGIASIEDAILERWFSRHFRENEKTELAGWSAMLTRTPVDGYAGTGAAIRDTDFTASTSAITIPTLCVVGDEDGSTPPDVVKGLADIIEGSRYSVIKGAGHLPCIEKPETMAALMTEFFHDYDLLPGGI